MLCCTTDNRLAPKAPKIENLTLRQFNQCLKALDIRVRN